MSVYTETPTILKVRKAVEGLDHKIVELERGWIVHLHELAVAPVVNELLQQVDTERYELSVNWWPHEGFTHRVVLFAERRQAVRP